MTSMPKGPWLQQLPLFLGLAGLLPLRRLVYPELTWGCTVSFGCFSVPSLGACLWTQVAVMDQSGCRVLLLSVHTTHLPSCGSVSGQLSEYLSDTWRCVTVLLTYHRSAVVP